MSETIGLFPTPLLRVKQALPADLVAALVQHFAAHAVLGNNTSPRLSHTAMLKPSESALFVQAAALVTPKLKDLGTLMFGEALGWSIKEMWVNVLAQGGHQAMHLRHQIVVVGAHPLFLNPASSVLFALIVV